LRRMAEGCGRSQSPIRVLYSCLLCLYSIEPTHELLSPIRDYAGLPAETAMGIRADAGKTPFTSLSFDRQLIGCSLHRDRGKNCLARRDLPARDVSWSSRSGKYLRVHVRSGSDSKVILAPFFAITCGDEVRLVLGSSGLSETSHTSARRHVTQSRIGLHCRAPVALDLDTILRSGPCERALDQNMIRRFLGKQSARPRSIRTIHVA
jgi:hypothetical protein